MADLTEYYRILGIDPASSPEVITAARDELTRVWNPERFPNDNRIRQMAVVKIAEIKAAHDVLIAHLNIGTSDKPNGGTIGADSPRTVDVGCEACGGLPIKAEEVYCSFCGARNLVETQNGHGIGSGIDRRGSARSDVMALQQKSVKKKAYLVLLAAIGSVIWFWFSSHQKQDTPKQWNAGAVAAAKQGTKPAGEEGLANFILDTVDHLDLSKMFAVSRSDIQGQLPASELKMMTALLFYSYCTGVPSSREIEKKTYEDSVFKVISGNRHPGHLSIVDLRNRHAGTLEDLFVQMLQLCQKAEYSEVGKVVIETSPSQHKETTSAMVKKKKEELERTVQALFRKAEAVDREEDKKYGVASRGWELPSEHSANGS